MTSTTTPPRITVVGTGYLGATHAVCMAKLGIEVLGVDVDERKIVENLFQFLGGSVKVLESDVIEVCAKNVDKWAIPEELCRKNRIAVLCAGPLLQRFGKVSFFGALGGDKIGKRPVNFHIDGLIQMGAHVEQVGNQYHLSVDERGLHGAHIKMPFPSVMTTESLLISAARARGSRSAPRTRRLARTVS